VTKSEQILKAVLRVTGVVTGLAVFAVLLPRDWMAAIHQWMGLGPYPEGVIVDYLARSLSAFYAILGGLLWVVAGDVRRYAAIITYLAWSGLVLGLVLLVVDLSLPMPLSWILSEAPIIFAVCIAILVLQTRD
jgi:hypothetical protein